MTSLILPDIDLESAYYTPSDVHFNGLLTVKTLLARVMKDRDLHSVYAIKPFCIC